MFESVTLFVELFLLFAHANVRIRKQFAIEIFCPWSSGSTIARTSLCQKYGRSIPLSKIVESSLMPYLLLALQDISHPTVVMLCSYFFISWRFPFIILEFSFSCNLRPHQCPHSLTVCHRGILSMVEWIDYIQNTPLSKVRQEHSAIKDSGELLDAVLAVGGAGHFPPDSYNDCIQL